MKRSKCRAYHTVKMHTYAEAFMRTKRFCTQKHAVYRFQNRIITKISAMQRTMHCVTIRECVHLVKL